MNDNKLPFLDMMLCLNAKLQVNTSVYVKASNTDLAMNFNSIAPTHFKRAAVYSLLHRAYTHSSTWHDFHLEVERIRVLFTKNCYPHHFLDRCVNTFMDEKHTTNTDADTDMVTDKITVLPLQFRGKHTYQFAALVRRCAPSIRVVFHTVKLRQCLPLHRQQTSPLLRSRLVYQYECAVCHNTYIGQTHRHLKTRIYEHNRGQLFEHHSSCHNTTPFSSCFTILNTCHSKRYMDLLTLEALYIKSEKPILNKQLHADSMLVRLPL